MKRNVGPDERETYSSDARLARAREGQLGVRSGKRVGVVDCGVETVRRRAVEERGAPRSKSRRRPSSVDTDDSQTRETQDSSEEDGDDTLAQIGDQDTG
jgi:hypothetical protein